MSKNQIPWSFDIGGVRGRPEGKKRNYRLHFCQNRRHVKVSLSTTNKSVAEREAIKIANQLHSGTLQSSPMPKTVRDAIAEFLASKRRQGISKKTDRKYSQELSTFAAFCAAQNIVRLDRFRESTLLDYKGHRQGRNLLTKTVRPIHEKTLSVAVMIVKTFVRWCCDQEWLLKDPFRRVKIAKPGFRPRYAPDLAIVNSLLAAAPEPLKSQIAVLAFTGMRSGEMQLLTPSDIDLSNGWIRVQTLKAKMTRVRPTRKVPIHPRLHAILEAHLKTLKSGDGRVFSAKTTPQYPTAGRPLDLRRLNCAVQRLAKPLKIETGRHADGLVVHSFRHFFETHAINSGIPQRVVDAWLGHSGDRSMGAVYYRLSDSDSQKFMRDHVRFDNHNS